jgi:hypothetical protein
MLYISNNSSTGGGMSNPMTTGGDIIYGGVSGTPTRLGNGTSGQVLTSNGTTLAPTWTTVSGTGDMILASAQTNSGVKTFLNATLGLRNVANTITSFFTNTATVARTWTLKDADGTIAFTSDITGTNSGINMGDQTITNTSDATSHTVTLSSSGGSVQLVEGSNITLTTSGTGSAGVVTIASTGGGSLTNFTEAVNTAAPNATVPAVSLTATNAATNVDAVFAVKGTGAILAQVPDNTTTGGNKRGTGAVDLQMSRTANTQVAGGTGSFAIGVNNTTGGTYAVAMGSTNTANAYSIAMGLSNNVSGSASAAFGASCSSTGSYSFCSGFGGVAGAIEARRVHGAAGFTAAGASQSSTFILVKATTDATPSVLTEQNGVPSATNQLILQNNNAMTFTGTLVGKQTASTNCVGWKLEGLIVRGTTAASTVVKSVIITPIDNTAGWGVPTLTADTTNGGLAVTVTGLAATSIRWVATLETSEVIYA